MTLCFLQLNLDQYTVCFLALSDQVCNANILDCHLSLLVVLIRTIFLSIILFSCDSANNTFRFTKIYHYPVWTLSFLHLRPILFWTSVLLLHPLFLRATYMNRTLKMRVCSRREFDSHWWRSGSSRGFAPYGRELWFAGDCAASAGTSSFLSGWDTLSLEGEKKKRKTLHWRRESSLVIVSNSTYMYELWRVLSYFVVRTFAFFRPPLLCNQRK